MSKYTYAVLGAGRQGTAAAYDLAKFGEANQIFLADLQEETAQRSARRVNQLIGREVASGTGLDVSDRSALDRFLPGVDVALSAVPYYFNLEITKACLAAGASMCDMGGHTGVVRQQLALDEEAKKAGIKVGTLRLITVWPFPEKRIKELAKKVKAFVVPEINYGQIVLEVERCVAGQTKVIGVRHCGGWVHNPKDILEKIKEAIK